MQMLLLRQKKKLVYFHHYPKILRNKNSKSLLFWRAGFTCFSRLPACFSRDLHLSELAFLTFWFLANIKESVGEKFCCGAVNLLFRTCRKRPFSKGTNCNSTAACSLFEMLCAGHSGAQLNMVKLWKHTVPLFLLEKPPFQTILFYPEFHLNSFVLSQTL